MHGSEARDSLCFCGASDSYYYGGRARCVADAVCRGFSGPGGSDTRRCGVRGAAALEPCVSAPRSRGANRRCRNRDSIVAIGSSWRRNVASSVRRRRCEEAGREPCRPANEWSSWPTGAHQREGPVYPPGVPVPGASAPLRWKLLSSTARWPAQGCLPARGAGSDASCGGFAVVACRHRPAPLFGGGTTCRCSLTRRCSRPALARRRGRPGIPKRVRGDAPGPPSPCSRRIEIAASLRCTNIVVLVLAVISVIVAAAPASRQHRLLRRWAGGCIARRLRQPPWPSSMTCSTAARLHAPQRR